MVISVSAAKKECLDSLSVEEVCGLWVRNLRRGNRETEAGSERRAIRDKGEGG